MEPLSQWSGEVSSRTTPTVNESILEFAVLCTSTNCSVYYTVQLKIDGSAVQNTTVGGFSLGASFRDLDRVPVTSTMGLAY